MRLALAQLNPVVGDLRGNAERILAAARSASAEGATLLLTPELLLSAATGLGTLLVVVQLDDLARGAEKGHSSLRSQMRRPGHNPAVLFGGPFTKRSPTTAER